MSVSYHFCHPKLTLFRCLNFPVHYKETIYEYDVVFDPNGAGYTVTVPKLPGLVTEGSNLKEAREMAKDAIRCYLEAVLKDDMLNLPKTGTVRRERVGVVA